MSTLSSIVSRAFRESQILDINRQPSTEQSTEALALLTGIIARKIRPPVQTVWIGDTTAIKEQRGGILKDFTRFIDEKAIPQDCYVNLVLDKSYSVLLPPSPGDGARLTFIDVSNTLATFPLTLIGNGNLVAGNPTESLGTNGQIYSIMFRRDIAQWIVIDPLVGTSNMPFPPEFDDMFSIELAIRINPRYGKEISGVTADIYTDIRSRFVSRYQQENSSAAPDILWETPFGTSGDLGRTY
jgi:hypothetical protein